MYQIESVGTPIAYRTERMDALDFAKHYSKHGTMMSVQIWRGATRSNRQYVCSFVDGRQCDSYIPEVQA